MPLLLTSRSATGGLTSPSIHRLSGDLQHQILTRMETTSHVYVLDAGGPCRWRARRRKKARFEKPVPPESCRGPIPIPLVVASVCILRGGLPREGCDEHLQ